MIQINKALVSKARSLSDLDKLKLVNVLLQDLDRPDPAIDREWGIEGRRRLRAMKSGKMKSHDFKVVMEKLRK